MNIRVDLNTPIKDGTAVVFRSPVDCSEVTGLKVYHSGECNEFAFADAHGNNVGDIPNLFAENVVVKVILDVTSGMAFIQNADTNAYLEGRLAGFEKSIAAIQAELAYEAIDITKFTNSAAGTYEMGTTITAVNLAWELNKEPASQTLDGASIGVDVRSESYTSLSLTSNKTYSLSVTDEKGATDKASSSITFLNGVYYGSMAYGSAIDSAAILALTKKLQSGKTVNFTVSSDRPVYALPTRYGTPTFKIGGFEYEWEKVSTFDFTNSSGYTESYDVWMHTQDVTGSVTVNVT